MKDVIIPLDFKDAGEALDLLGLFKGERPYVKIGMELFYSEGPDIVKKIAVRGHKVFLDLKLHDIPNTVERAMRNIALLGVDMVNVHASGTADMMKAALEGLRSSGGRTLLIAVTQLTSTSEQRMRDEILIERTIGEVVESYALNAKKSGLDGVVCSPLEAAIVKKACGNDFLAVTPGIRYAEGTDDQARVTDPEGARQLGCDYIVVGRPITRAADPIAAYRKVRKEFLGE